MTSPDRVGAATILRDLRRGQRIPDPAPAAVQSYTDADIDAGLDLQLAVLDSFVADGEDVGGWKIGWTSRGARDQMGVGFRPFGYVLADKVLPSGAKIELAEFTDCFLEVEIGVVMGTDLAGADVTVEQARDAVAAVAPAFEVGARHLPQGSAVAIRLGNGLNNWGIVMGAPQSKDLRLDDLQVSLSCDGKSLGTGGTGPDVIDDPYLSLTRICQTLDRFGRGLRAGQSLITGSVLPGIKVSEPGHWVGDFGALGTVTATFH
jgi:2-keto-4-pentenoate hydratase